MIVDGISDFTRPSWIAGQSGGAAPRTLPEGDMASGPSSGQNLGDASKCDSIQISSGRSIMLARLFKSSGSSEEPPVLCPGKADSTASVFNFLTMQDRQTISSAYEYARKNGIDLSKVDGLAADLGNYRSSPSASYVDSVGKTFDENGNPVIFSFTDSDEATAQRILSSKAFKDNALPEAFLRHELDPGYQGPAHAADFGFLESFVYATSSSGSDGSTDPTATLAPRPAQRLALMKASGDLPLIDPVQKSVQEKAGSGQIDSFTSFLARLPGAGNVLTDRDKATLRALYYSIQSLRHNEAINLGYVAQVARSMIFLQKTRVPASDSAY